MSNDRRSKRGMPAMRCDRCGDVTYSPSPENFVGRPCPRDTCSGTRRRAEEHDLPPLGVR